MKPALGLRPAIVSFLGIDGIGKSTLARRLQLAIEEGTGRPCEVISRRSFLGAAEDGFVKDTVLSAYGASLRTLYGQALLVDGTRLGRRFPAKNEDLLVREFEVQLSAAEIVRNDPDALIATAIGEIAAHAVFDRLVLRPRVAAGSFVLQETHGIKSIIKSLLLAEELLAPDDPRTSQLAGILELATRTLRPAGGDVSIFVDGDPDRALRQRLAQSGKVGGWEHYGIATGDSSTDSYLRLQRNCRVPFAAVAREWDALLVDRDTARFGTVDGAATELWSLVKTAVGAVRSRPATD